MDLGLSGKRALVLSSSRGLGLGIAQALAREGAAVMLTARNADRLKAAADAINGEGKGRAHYHAGDLAGGVEAIHAAAVKALGAIDILVANTGGPPARTAAAVKPEEWTPQFEAMVAPVFHLASLVLPGMRERGWGRLVTVASSGVVQPIPNLAISNALRSAILGWSKTLAAEVAGDGVTVQPGPAGPHRNRSARRARRRQRQGAGQERRGHCRQRQGDDPGRPLRPGRGIRRRGLLPRLRARQLHHRQHGPHRRRHDSLGLEGGGAYFGCTGSVGEVPGGGITGVVPGFGTGAGTVMSGVAVAGGLITPSVRLSRSLRVSPVEPVVPRSGAIFSAGTLSGLGILGARGWVWVWASEAVAIAPLTTKTKADIRKLKLISSSSTG